MAMQSDPLAALTERDEYFEDLAIEREDDRLRREHEIRVLKLKQGRAGRYKLAEKVLVTIFKIIPYCFAIMALTILSLAKREIPSSLSEFIS